MEVGVAGSKKYASLLLKNVLTWYEIEFERISSMLDNLTHFKGIFALLISLFLLGATDQTRPSARDLDTQLLSNTLAFVVTYTLDDGTLVPLSDVPAAPTTLPDGW